jgi:DNA-binding NarL/FixJ family response regulator
MIAVEPLALSRAVELLLDAGPEMQILPHPDAANMSRHAKRLQPDLLITNAQLLGAEARTLLKNFKRVSPHSKIIVTDFDARLDGIEGHREVDAYLEEETLVRGLLATVRRLMTRGRQGRAGRG